MFPLRAIIATAVALRIHPNVLTFVGVLINVAAACALGLGRFVLAGVIMIVANIFDFIDGKVAVELNAVSPFGGFWDSVIDRFSDISLFIGLIFLYSQRERTDSVMIAALAMMFAIMTSYTRARRIAHPQVQGRLHGAPRTHRPFHDRRVHQPHGRRAVGDPRALHLHRRRPDHPDLSRASGRPAAGRGMKNPVTLPGRILWNAFFWTYERATWQYDLMVIAILAFIWLTPPDWLSDPTASGSGPVGWLIDRLK
jgi:phosphatidylglycerophosphate synthase